MIFRCHSRHASRMYFEKCVTDGVDNKQEYNITYCEVERCEMFEIF